MWVFIVKILSTSLYVNIFTVQSGGCGVGRWNLSSRFQQDLESSLVHQPLNLSVTGPWGCFDHFYGEISLSKSLSVVSDSLRPHGLYSPWILQARILEW